MSPSTGVIKSLEPAYTSTVCASGLHECLCASFVLMSLIVQTNQRAKIELFTSRAEDRKWKWRAFVKWSWIRLHGEALEVGQKGQGVIKIHFLRKLNMCTEFYGDMAQSCWMYRQSCVLTIHLWSLYSPLYSEFALLIVLFSVYWVIIVK